MRQGSSKNLGRPDSIRLTRPCHPLRSRAPLLISGQRRARPGTNLLPIRSQRSACPRGDPAPAGVRLSYSTIPCGPTRPAAGAAVRRRRTARPPSHVELDRAEHPFVPLNGHPQRGQEPLGRVEVHHDPLIGFDVLAAGCKRLRIQAEVEDDFLGRGRDPAEIRIGRQRRGIVDDDLGLLLGLWILCGWAPSGTSLPSFSLISGSGVS